MKVFSFVQTLLTDGKITVDGALSAFEEDDLSDSAKLLSRFYEEDIVHMPLTAPAFEAGPAVWAAKHLYLSLQLIVLRELPPQTIEESLEPFNGEISPSSIYSADLVLRYLPDIFNLARGLAPADIMVTKMAESAAYWPFSSVGIPLQQEIDDSIILNHPSLKTAYIDRIIRTKDIKRISDENMKEYVMEALGNYAAVLWPDFYELSSNITHAR